MNVMVLVFVAVREMQSSAFPNLKMFLANSRIQPRLTMNEENVKQQQVATATKYRILFYNLPFQIKFQRYSFICFTQHSPKCNFSTA